MINDTHEPNSGDHRSDICNIYGVKKKTENKIERIHTEFVELRAVSM